MRKRRKNRAWGNAKGGSCAPRAIPGVGCRKQNQLAALDGLWEIARGAADPPQPIRHTAMLGDSEILSKKCSKHYLCKHGAGAYYGQERR